MPTRLLLLAVVCHLATSQSLQMKGSRFMVELEEGKDQDPKYLLKKLYTIRVECSMTASDNTALTEPTIEWHKIGSNDTLDSRYDVQGRLSPDSKNFTSTLSMRRLSNEDITNYTCTGSTKIKTQRPVTEMAILLSRPLITFSIDHGVKVSDVALWPGQSVNIKCIAEGNPTPAVVEWFKETPVGLTNLTQNALLNLTNLNYELDRGFVSCKSRNEFGENSAKIFLRVKNPKAYLAPLIIIIIEVVIIGIVVGVYEYYLYRKRKQNDLAAGAAYKAE